MSVRESPYGPGRSLLSQPTNVQYPPVIDQNRLSQPTLPSMSTLLRGEDLMNHGHRHYPPPGYQLYANQTQQYPPNQNDHHSGNPPQSTYRPIQSQYSGEGYNIPPSVVAQNHIMPAPRRMEPLVGHEEARESASMMEGGYKLGTDSHDLDRTRPAVSSPSFLPATASSDRRKSLPHTTGNVPISGLLSSKESSSLEHTSEPRYTIRMRQQPMAARACGFGERDRRVIDPPPILQMDIDSPTSTPEQISALIRSPYTVVHCTLWDPTTDRDGTAMPGTADKRQQRRLMGTLVASPFVGLDEHYMEGCFFTFPDLSVRTPGTYTLKFKLVVVNPQEMQEGFSAPVKSTVMSSAFTVYNAKDFRGMRASTALTKTLKHQGCLISVKKGNARSNETNARDNDEGDDNDGYEDEGD